MKWKFVVMLLFVFTGSQSVTAQSLLNQKEKFTRADTLRGSLRPERTCYDVMHYDLHIRIDTARKSISGSNKIRFKALSSFNSMQIDLFDNMTIVAITRNGNPLEYSREENAVFVTMDKPVKQGEISTVTVAYSGKPIEAKRAPWDGGFTWSQDENKKPWIAVSCEGIGASLWWPCKDYLGDEPDSMRITCTYPMGLKCISNGVLERDKNNTDATATTSWVVSYPINNYNVTLNIGDYVHLHDEYIADDSARLDLDYYVLSYNTEKAKEHFKQVKPMMACYEKYLGKYPFWNDGYALVETPYLGMEHQGAIAYGNKYLTGYAGSDFSRIGLNFDYIIIHETGHEWWGNSVSCSDIADMWIHESFCTYSESIFVECLYGTDTAMKYINAKKKQIGNKEPIVGVYGVNEEGSGDMYSKGSLILNTVRYIFNNDALWWSTIKAMSDTVFKMKNTNYTEIEQFFSSRSGRDLSKIFEQYLKYPKIPVLEYKLTKVKKGNYELSYRWVTDVEGFGMPFYYSTPYLTNQKVEASNIWQSTVVKIKRDAAFKLNEDFTYYNTHKVDTN